MYLTNVIQFNKNKNNLRTIHTFITSDKNNIDNNVYNI